MFSKNSDSTDFITEGMVGAETASPETGPLGPDHFSNESPFDCILNVWGMSRDNNNFPGEQYKGTALSRHDEIEINVFMEAQTLLIIDIQTEGIAQSSRLIYDEVGISDNPPDGIANYLPAEEAYRLVSSKAQGAATIRTIGLRLENMNPYDRNQQKEWTVKNIEVWKIKVG